jgi:pimeloyl-ACP methyl ester carboxylesterase
MGTYVLVHGAWHTGRELEPVEALIEAAGHKAVTPTMKGNRAGDAKTVGLAEAILSIVDSVTEHDLKDVVLVGHSYCGMIITGVADALPDRIRVSSTGTRSSPTAAKAWSIWCRHNAPSCSMPLRPNDATAPSSCRQPRGIGEAEFMATRIWISLNRPSLWAGDGPHRVEYLRATGPFVGRHRHSRVRHRSCAEHDREVGAGEREHIARLTRLE